VRELTCWLLCGSELEAKVRELEEKLKTAWTDERRKESQAELTNRLAAAEEELARVSTQFLALEELTFRSVILISLVSTVG
jgi:glutathione S-transferase